MNLEAVIAIIIGVLSLMGTFVSYYFYIRGQVCKSVNEVIDGAESVFEYGAEKFEFAVDRLMILVPRMLSPFIRRSWVERLVQFAFDKIESYAKKQIAKKKEANIADRFESEIL